MPVLSVRRARLTDRKIELDETMLTALNERYQLLLSVLDAEPEVEITYFVPDERKSGGAYRTVSGVVKKADEFARRLTLTDGTGDSDGGCADAGRGNIWTE